MTSSAAVAAASAAAYSVGSTLIDVAVLVTAACCVLRVEPMSPRGVKTTPTPVADVSRVLQGVFPVGCCHFPSALFSTIPVA